MQVQTQGVKNIKKFVNINILLVMGNMVHLFQDTGRLNVKNAQKLHRAMAKGKKMLRASGICKSYGKRRIIEQAEFLPEGEAA